MRAWSSVGYRHFRGTCSSVDRTVLPWVSQFRTKRRYLFSRPRCAALRKIVMFVITPERSAVSNTKQPTFPWND